MSGRCSPIVRADLSWLPLRGCHAQENLSIRGISGAGVSFRRLGLRSTKTHRLKPAPLARAAVAAEIPARADR
jgi:hypothetical protein